MFWELFTFVCKYMKPNRGRESSTDTMQGTEHADISWCVLAWRAWISCLPARPNHLLSKQGILILCKYHILYWAEVPCFLFSPHISPKFKPKFSFSQTFIAFIWGQFFFKSRVVAVCHIKTKKPCEVNCLRVKINILFGFSKHLQAQILFYPQTWKHSEPVCPCGGALAFLSAQFETVYINMLSWFENMSSADALWVTSTLHDRLPTDAT